MEGKAAQSQKWAITLFTIGVFMAGLDNGIISTALTTINDAFGVSPAWGAWSITLYTLGVAISVPIIGKLSDRFGRRRLFLIEVTLFGIGSLLVALSPNFIFLLAARFLQSIGGGGIFIIASSHVLTTLPKEKQGKVLGLLGGMNGIAAVIGPNLGAVILGITGSWHWMFLINIPIAIFLILFGYLKIEETSPGTSAPLDLTGTILLGAGILALMYGITNIDSQKLVESISHISAGPFMIAGIVLFIIFILHERRLEAIGGDPILKYSLLQKRLFQVTLVLGLLSGGFLAGIIFIPSYVQQVLQIPAEQAGYWLTPMALASGVGAGLGGYLTDKQGAVKTVIYAGVLGAVGFFLFPVFVSGLGTFVLASVLAGIGLGILLGAPLNVLVGESAKKSEEGAALGALSLVRQIGLSLFPTLYAGFVAGAFTKVGPALERYDDMGVGTVKEDNYGEVISQLSRIADPAVREQAFETAAAVLRSGFNDMYITAGILALIVMGIGVYLSRKRQG
jgi:EmrB/QacA subfamily drug resistance transporter